MTQTISYDFVSENICTAVVDILYIAQVTPNSITFNRTEYDNVTIEFDTTTDAIRFTEIYLDSDDPSDIMEYVVNDTLTTV